MSTHASTSVGGSVEMKELSTGRNKKVIAWKTYNPAEDEEDERNLLVASSTSAEQGQKEKQSKAAVAVNPEEDEITKKRKIEEEEEEERKRKGAAAGAGGAADGKSTAGADLAMDKRCCCILTPLVLAILFLVLGGIILAIIFGVLAPLFIPVVVPVGASPSTILVPNIPAAESLGKSFALQVEGFTASDKPVTVYTASALPSLSAEKKKLYFADSLLVDKTKQHQKYGPIYLATGAVVGITYKYQSTAGPLVLYILNTIQAAQYAVNPNVLIAGTCSCYAYTKSYDLYPNSLNSTIYYTAILPDNYVFVTVFKDKANQDGFLGAELAFSTEVPVVNVDGSLSKVCTLDQQTSTCELPKTPWLYAVAQQELTEGVVTPSALMLKYGFQPDSGKYAGLILGLLFGLLALSCVLSLILIAVRMILARVVPFLTTKFVCLKCCICCCICLGRKEKANEFMKKIGGGAAGGLAVGTGLKTEGLGAGLAVDASLESGLGAGAGIGAGVGKIGSVGADISGGLGAGLKGGLDVGLGIKAGLGLEAAVSARTRRAGFLMKKRMGLLVESELEFEERMKKNSRRRRRAFLYAYRLRYDPSGKQYDSEEEEEERKRRKQKEGEKEKKKKSKEEEEEERVREEEDEKRRKRRRYYRYYRNRRTDEDIVIYGRWQGGVQGGPKNSTTYYNNEQYVVQTGEKGGKVHIVVKQKKQEDEENKKEKESRRKNREEPQDQNREFFYAVYRVPDESKFEEDSKKPLNSIIASSKSTVEEFEKKYLVHTSQTKEEVVESDVVLESDKRYIIVVSQMSLMDGFYELTLSSAEISFTFVISESSAVSEESQVIVDGDKTNSYAYKREVDLIASNHQEQGKKTVQEVISSNKSSHYVVYNNYHEKDIHCYLDYYSEEKKQEEENKNGEGSSKQSRNDNENVTVYVLRGYEYDQKHYKSSDEKQKEIPSRDVVAVLSKGSAHEFVLQPSDTPYFIIAIHEAEEQKEGQQTYHFTLYSDAETHTDQQAKREEHVMDKIKSQVLDYAVEVFDKLKKLEEEQKQQQVAKKQQKSQSSLVSQGQEKKQDKSEEEQKKEEQQRKEDEQRIFNKYREAIHELKEYFATKDENNERGTVTQQEFVQIVKEYHISLGYYKLEESEIQLLSEMYSDDKKDQEQKSSESSSNNKQSQKGSQSSSSQQEGQKMTNYERFINDLEKKDSKESSDPSESPLHPYLQYLEKVAREEQQKNEQGGKSSQSDQEGTVKIYHYNDCVYALVQGSLDRLEDILPQEAKENKIPLKIMLMTDKPFPTSFVENNSESQGSSKQGKEKREEMQKKQQQQVERITEAANQFDNHLSKLETYMNLSGCNTAVFCEPSGGLSQQFATDVLQSHEFVTKQAVWVKVEDEHADDEEKSSKSEGEKGSSSSTSGSASSSHKKQTSQEAFETFVVGHCSKRAHGSSSKEESGSQSGSSSSSEKNASTSQNDNKTFEEVIDWKHKETVLAYPSSSSGDRRYVDNDGSNEDQKPLGLVRHLIYNFSNIGDLVLDVASGGSATTLIASYLEKRSCIVVEQSEEAFRRLVENFERVKGSAEDVTERKKMYSFESADCICDCKCP